MRQCELCGYIGTSGMHHGVHTACNNCIWEVVKFAISSGMRFNHNIDMKEILGEEE